MGPVERITERRQIRRAAEEALTDNGPRPMSSFEYNDPRRDDLPPGFYGRPTRPAPVAEPEPTRPTYVNGYASQQVPRLTSTQLEFRMRATPWYRKRAVLLTLVALGLVAAAVSLVVLLWPASTPAPQETGTTTAPAPSPSPSTSASLAPPAPPSVVLPPPPPPPPPETTPSAAPPPVYYPRYDPPSTKPPEINVTRTPISVSPTVKPSKDRNSSTPGDSPGGGWGW